MTIGQHERFETQICALAGAFVTTSQRLSPQMSDRQICVLADTGKQLAFQNKRLRCNDANTT
ncbi:hypothetical protein FHT97_004384 [Rhizobium sp. BK399]|nr:hypothetical protein [Rhizobium sp. BK399]MCS3741871.1 hypothetical protein [Rhizobium sp. BK661]